MRNLWLGVSAFAVMLGAWLTFSGEKALAPVLADVYDCSLPMVHPMRRMPGGSVEMACELDTVPPSDMLCDYRITEETLHPVFYCDVE